MSLARGVVGHLPWWYDDSMKQKTSVTLSPAVLAEIDRHAASDESRSAFIERVLRRYFKHRTRRAIGIRDLELLNRAAARLNEEAADVIEYQAPWPEE